MAGTTLPLSDSAEGSSVAECAGMYDFPYSVLDFTSLLMGVIGDDADGNTQSDQGAGNAGYSDAADGGPVQVFESPSVPSPHLDSEMRQESSAVDRLRDAGRIASGTGGCGQHRMLRDQSTAAALSSMGTCAERGAESGEETVSEDEDEEVGMFNAILLSGTKRPLCTAFTDSSSGDGSPLVSPSARVEAGDAHVALGTGLEDRSFGDVVPSQKRGRLHLDATLLHDDESAESRASTPDTSVATCSSRASIKRASGDLQVDPRPMEIDTNGRNNGNI